MDRNKLVAGRAAGAGASRRARARVRAAKLVHEAVDHAVEREAIVVARVREVDEVAVEKEFRDGAREKV